MIPFLLALLLLCGARNQNASAKPMDFPIPNIFDIPGSIQRLQSFVSSTFFEPLQNLGKGAIDFGQGALQNIQKFFESILGNGLKDIGDGVNQMVTGLEEAIDKSPIGGTRRALECKATAIFNTNGAVYDTVTGVIRCTTDRVGSFFSAASDLIQNGLRALGLLQSLVDTYNECFQGGIKGGFEAIGQMACAAGKLGPKLGEVGDIAAHVTQDVQIITSDVVNAPDSITTCPQNVVSNFFNTLGTIKSTFEGCLAKAF